MMKKIFGLIIMLILGVNSYAIDTQVLKEAHREAWKVYEQDKDYFKAVSVLRGAKVKGLSNIYNYKSPNKSFDYIRYDLKGIDNPLNKPSGITNIELSRILYDYAYFLSLFQKPNNDQGGEKYVDAYVQFYSTQLEAINFFLLSLYITPDYPEAYLALADIYWKLYLLYVDELNKPEPFSQIILRSPNAVYDLYNKYYKLMITQNVEYQIPDRVIDFTFKERGYVLLYDDLEGRNEDKLFCKDYVKNLNLYLKEVPSKCYAEVRESCKKGITNEYKGKFKPLSSWTKFVTSSISGKTTVEQREELKNTFIFYYKDEAYLHDEKFVKKIGEKTSLGMEIPVCRIEYIKTGKTE